MAQLNKFKTLSALLYLTRTKAGGEIDYYKVVKMMYFADKEHLQRRGSTITNDFYVRMDHGSTGSKTLEMLQAIRGDENKDPRLREFAYGRLSVIGSGSLCKVRALGYPDLDDLSPSEIEVLSEIYDKYKAKSFTELRELAHDDAYNARNRDDFYRIEYEEMAGSNEDLIAYLNMIATNA